MPTPPVTLASALKGSAPTPLKRFLGIDGTGHNVIHRDLTKATTLSLAPGTVMQGGNTNDQYCVLVPNGMRLMMAHLRLALYGGSSMTATPFSTLPQVRLWGLMPGIEPSAIRYDPHTAVAAWPAPLYTDGPPPKPEFNNLDWSPLTDLDTKLELCTPSVEVNQWVPTADVTNTIIFLCRATLRFSTGGAKALMVTVPTAGALTGGVTGAQLVVSLRG